MVPENQLPMVLNNQYSVHWPLHHLWRVARVDGLNNCRQVVNIHFLQFSWVVK